MDMCLCGGALIRATTHGDDPAYSREQTPDERMLEAMMRRNRGLTA